VRTIGNHGGDTQPAMSTMIPETSRHTTELTAICSAN